MYLRIDFPSGKYYAARTHAPSLPEWPPHPSRIFSALVASACRSCAGITTEKQATLKWFETLSLPSIAAPRAELNESPIFYVPPGDSTGRKGLRGQEVYEHGVHRWRQPRHFPCAIILNEPTVYYGWNSDPESSILAALEEIVADVTHVGTSHSMVTMSAHIGKMPKKPTLIPDQRGTKFFRVPTAGRLDELDVVYENKTGVRRPPASCEPLAAYKDTYDRSDTGDVSDLEFMALRISGTMHGADTAVNLARALRRAVMSVLGNDAPAAVHGHNGGMHIGWLPLPDVGHRHAKGRIVGIGIALPRRLDLEQRQQVLSGISRIKDLHLPNARTAQLSAIVPGERVGVALKNQTWVKPSTI